MPLQKNDYVMLNEVKHLLILMRYFTSFRVIPFLVDTRMKFHNKNIRAIR